MCVWGGDPCFSPPGVAPSQAPTPDGTHAGLCSLTPLALPQTSLPHASSPWGSQPWSGVGPWVRTAQTKESQPGGCNTETPGKCPWDTLRDQVSPRLDKQGHPAPQSLEPNTGLVGGGTAWHTALRGEGAGHSGLWAKARLQPLSWVSASVSLAVLASEGCCEDHGDRGWKGLRMAPVTSRTVSLGGHSDPGAPPS